MANEWWKYALGALGGPIGLGAVALGENVDFTGAKEKQAELAKFQEQQRIEREAAKQKRLAALGQIKGPSIAPELSGQQQARMAALQQESQAPIDTSMFDKQIYEGPLSQDPRLQAQRAQLVQGGAGALAGVQNVQRATGASGGFRNVGSVADIYDRLGAQMAQLGGRAYDLNQQAGMQRLAYTQGEQQRREAKRSEAANIEQQALDAKRAYQDSQIAFQNAQARARDAIEAGDDQAAMQATMEAYQARQAGIDADRKLKTGLVTGLIQGAATAAGGYFGGPAGAQMGSQLGGSLRMGGEAAPTPNNSYAMGEAPTFGLSARSSRPWASMRNG